MYLFIVGMRQSICQVGGTRIKTMYYVGNEEGYEQDMGGDVGEHVLDCFEVLSSHSSVQTGKPQKNQVQMGYVATRLSDMLCL